MRIEPHSDSAWSDDARHPGVVVSVLVVAMSKTAECVVTLDVGQYYSTLP